MNQESSTPTAVAEAPKEANAGIQPGMEDRAEAINSVERTKAKLGEFAAGQQVQADTSGNLYFGDAAKQEQAFHQEHGHGSNETATRV